MFLARSAIPTALAGAPSHNLGKAALALLRADAPGRILKPVSLNAPVGFFWNVM